MAGRAVVVALWCVSHLACGSNGGPSQTNPPSGSDTIVLNPAITHQTIVGWEEPVISTVLDYSPILGVMGPILDQAVNDLGINRISVGVTSGDENPSDACQQQYLNRSISEGEWVRTCAYNSVNDNSDPNVVNPNGFHFAVLDWQIEHKLLPLKQRVEARGEKLYVLLRYVDFGSSAFEHHQNPEEYAEFMEVAFNHLATKYGVIPDGIDVMNEPDNVPFWPEALGPVVAASGRRLAGRGYRPDFVGPSATDKARAVPYFDRMMGTQGASQYIKELSWHCYANNDANQAAAIASKALQYGVRTSMTECWHSSNTYLMLHQELKTSRNAAWGLGILNGPNGYYDVNAATGQATLRPKAKFIRQYYKHIRAGATRIDATTGNAVFDPVAFVNSNGRYVVVVKASAGGTFTIGNLPSGTYGIFYTTGPDGLTVTNYDVNLADQSITAGRSLSTSIPAAGVITIYAKGGSAGGAAAATTARPDAPTVAVEGVVDGGSQAWPKHEFVTHDGVPLRLEEIAGSVADPVDLAFTPDRRLFVAERDGHVRIVREGRLLPEAALSPNLCEGREEQLRALAIDPSFDRNHYVYTISVGRMEDGNARFCLARFREVSGTLADRIILLDEIPSTPTAAASLRFGPDGKLFAAFDDADVPLLAGDFASANGKVLRLNSDGTTPDDQAAGRLLFSYPYRSPRGLDWHPTTHALWVADRDLRDTSHLTVVATVEGPKRGEVRTTVRLPAGSPASAVVFYRGAPNAAMRDNLFVASDEGRHLLRVELDPQEPTHVLATERLLDDVIGGIRVVAAGPDGALYIGTGTSLGRLVPGLNNHRSSAPITPPD
jgi:glucose/arabinose dehydrogenase